MPGDYELTHSLILESAKKLFLENGYERTNLRDICKGADVTNGAFYRHFESKKALFSELVQPCVDYLHSMYEKSEKMCYDKLTADSILLSIEEGNKFVRVLIDFIYDNFDEFKLLIRCSDGTPQHSFVEDLVDIEVAESIKFFNEARIRGVKIIVPNERTIHMLSHCYFASLFECVEHDFKKEEAYENIDAIVRFFNAGWKNILGI